MSQMKRQLSFSRTTNEQVKKVRKITCLEDLSNELFYEIFDYLDACDIHQTFSNLNTRFENLLTNSLLPLKVHLTSKSQPTLEDRCRHVILPNNHRILSLHLYDDSLIRSFCDRCTIDSSFASLQSVILNGLSAYKLMTMLFYLNSLPKLFSLTIQLEEDYYYNISDMCRLIFRLPRLKYCSVTASDCEESDISMPMSINEKPSTIEHLVINFACNVKEITSLLLHTPRLQRLTCGRLVENDGVYTKEEQLTLPHLTHISIVDCDIEFNELEIFIKKIGSKLRVLRLKTSNFTTYLDAKRWKQLIKKHLPYLYEFHFDCHASTDTLMDITPDVETLRTFTSTFWTERRWFFKFTDAIDQFVYSIHPHKKMWFDDPQHQQTINHSKFDQLTIQSIQLTIEGYTADEWAPSYIDDLKPCFTAVPFTHLTIDCNGLPIGMLIEIIRLLPNLHSLELSSVPLLQPESLSFEDSEMLLLVSIMSKITRVKLKKMDAIEQIYLLMDLCPRMEYLEIGYATENDLEKVLGCISLNNNTRIPYLSCLCLCVPDATERTIQNVHTIIDFERLFQTACKIFPDYIIHSRQNKVFLNWRLSYDEHI